MKILDSGTTSKGVIIKVISYNTLEKIKKGYPFSVLYISSDGERDFGYASESKAREAFAYELFKSIISELKKYLTYSGKEKDYNHYDDFISFLIYCCDLDCIERPIDFMQDDVRSSNYIYIVNYKVRKNIDHDILDKLGQYKKFAIMNENLFLSLAITLNMITLSSFDSIVANISGDKIDEIVLNIDFNSSNGKESDTMKFMCNFASKVYL